MPKEVLPHCPRNYGTHVPIKNSGKLTHIDESQVTIDGGNKNFKKINNMTKKDFVGKTFTVGDINGNSNWNNELLEWYGRRQLEGTITINRITDKNTVFFTLDITKPYRKHFNEMRGKLHGVIEDENGDWKEAPYIIRNFDSWGNVEWRGRYHLWRELT